MALAVQVFLMLLLVMGLAVLISIRHWEWDVPGYLKGLLVSGLERVRQETVTVHLFYSPGTIAQIEHSLLNLKEDLVKMEKVWGVRFHILISLPDSIINEQDGTVRLLERRFPEMLFVYERG